jgi:hypothetical protein
VTAVVSGTFNSRISPMRWLACGVNYAR